MDYYTILAQRAHLTRDVAGRRVETVRRAGQSVVYIGFEGGRALKLAAIPDMPYLVSADPRHLPRKNAPSWHQNRFEKRVLADVSITPGDRVLTFSFDTGARLIFEMTGRHANIVAVDGDGIIIGALRRVTSRESSVRRVTSGVAYEPPPHRDYPDIFRGVLPDLERRFEAQNGTAAEALRWSIACGSGLFAAEVCALAEIPPETALSDLTADHRFRLFETAAALATSIEAGGEGGSIVYRKDGLPQDVFPLKLTAGGFSTEYFDDLDGAISRYARTREIELERRSLSASITSALAAEERRVRSTITKIEGESGDDTKPEMLDRQANTLLANLHRIKRGATSVELDDIYGGGKLSIPLDPALDPAANAERLFRRAKKLRASSVVAARRLETLRETLARIARDRAETDATDDIRELRTLAARHIRPQFKREDSTDEESLFPRRFASTTGLDIIVGRNDRENDDLVRRARKTDLWLHAQYIGGSHVILRARGKQPPDRKSIEQAAAIAAFYSKARTSSVVPVVVTHVKYVTKRKGQGPGKVTYTREEVLFVEPGKG